MDACGHIVGLAFQDTSDHLVVGGIPCDCIDFQVSRGERGSERSGIYEVIDLHIGPSVSLAQVGIAKHAPQII
jgi:hypothetical protein